ncbi:YkvA family protein [Pelagibacterium lacus]|uniref:DUF1232 domain-containing protein n=1 Tax=Pelagibacterium lacus TaxID=2282655 RepID=A0A369W2W3_9HYPH|nr:DUF1232 domain-containing protein [Pelagibacterium lacus]RDE07612.1 DUF1232 domain-containing protein [Pelagibacterium lacus]
MIKNLASLLLPRILRFRKEAFLLWKAFWAPGTPLYLKLATLGAVAYLVWPMDLLPDIIPLAGLVDDVILIPLIVSWIVSRLPRPAPVHAEGPVIDGTARRL